jgi:lysophospholipase L1-like esterase
VRERNRIAVEFIRERGIPVNDLFSPVVERPECFREDGVHFNAQGNEILGRQVVKVIERHLPKAMKAEVKEGALPRVLLIGDSIRMGYEPYVRELLKDIAEVHGVEMNCGPTVRGLEHLDRWLGDTRWDLIHFNFGLHDLKHVIRTSEGEEKAVNVPEGQRQVPLDRYERNLDEIVRGLKRTGAKLIFATTTPVPEGTGIRLKGDAAMYNLVALRVMRKHDVRVNDLYHFVKGRQADLQRPNNVHFTDRGSQALAEQVAEAIKEALAAEEPRKAEGEITIYVSPDGDDDNPGTIEKPLATLHKAREVARRLKDEHPDRNITVYLRGGIYHLRETVVFTVEDSGNPGQRITYAAYPGERPVLSGGVPIKSWRKLDERECPEELPGEARGRIWVADVSFIREIKERGKPPPTVAEGMETDWRFYTLYSGEERLPRARGKAFTLVRRPDEEVEADLLTFVFPKGAMRNWSDVRNAELVLIPKQVWISNILPIESVDEERCLGRVRVPSTYPLQPPVAMSYRPTAWIENSIALLDEPGEWVLDPEKCLLYFWPPEGVPGEWIVAPVLTELIRVEGEIDYEGPEDRPVRNIAFRGLTFTHGDRFPWHGRTGWGLQHDWERFDSPTALLRFRGAEDCVVEGCRFVNSGGTGVRLDLHCRGISIVGNRFEHLGGVGILLAGYGPGTKDVNKGNEITNNLIHDIGELYWGSPGIFAWQSGENIIAHNHIYNLPYTGICITGRIVWSSDHVEECSKTIRWWEMDTPKSRWTYAEREESWYERERYLHSRRNLVWRNDVHGVTRICGDGNCIYVSGAGEENRVVENFCHDTPGVRMNAAIRCDDDQHETLMERNIIFRNYDSRAEGFISKGKNHIIGNLIVDLRDIGRHRGYVVFYRGDPTGSIICRNVFYSRKRGQSIYWPVNESGEPIKLGGTRADHNLYHCTDDPEWGERFLDRARRLGVEEHSISADPMFYNIDARDFRFKPDSPALKLGIGQPISIDEVGLEPRYREILEEG